MSSFNTLFDQLNILKQLKLYLTESKKSLEIFVDSSDVIQMVKGYRCLYTNLGVFKTDDFESDRFFVQNLIYSGKLSSQIKILTPHQDELSYNIGKKFGIYDDYIDEARLDRLIADTDTYVNETREKSINLVSTIVERGVKDFNVPTSVRDKTWKGRLRNLFDSNNPIIELSDDSDYFPRVTSTDLFKALLDGFSAHRKGEKQKNFNDAVALAIIAEKVQQFKEGNGSLPIFYASEEFFQLVIDDKKLQSHFEVDMDNQAVSIIRDQDYFIVNAIFSEQSAETEKNLELIDHYREISEFKQTFEDKLAERDIYGLMHLNSDLEKYRDHNFIKHILIRYYKSSNYKEIYEQMRLNTGDIDQKFIAKLDEELEHLTGRLNSNLSTIVLYKKISSSILSALQKFLTEISDTNLEIESFRDLALVRFSIDGNLVRRVNADIFEIQQAKNLEKVTEKKTLDEMCNRYASVLTDAYEGRRESSEDVLLVIIMLWILKLDDLLIQQTKDHREMGYQVSLIRCAAQIRSNQITEEEFDTEMKYFKSLIAQDDKNGKNIKLGIAYLMYHMAGSNDIFTINEKVPETKNLKHTESMRYAFEAYRDFEVEAEKNPNSLNSIYSLYALNILIYYTVETGLNEDLTEIESYVNKFLYQKDIQNKYWNYRFTDTLARFFHRRHIMSQSGDNQLMEIAKKFSNESVQNAVLKSDIMGYAAKLHLK